MRTSDFDYDLPKEFIAQYPVSPRCSSKLLVYDSLKDEVSHMVFKDLIKLLNSNDVLVVNRSKVISARVLFEIDNKKYEIFILKETSKNIFNCMVRSGRYFSKGRKFNINKDFFGEVLEVNPDGTRLIKFNSNILSMGTVPLPPYIKNSDVDLAKYQTVYSKEEGSVAAPTAGLHFTKKLINMMKDRDINIEEVILHIGRGTFMPVKTNIIEDHIMHSEEYHMPINVAERLNQFKKNKKRIIAVGTTSVRVLESSFDKEKGFISKYDDTDLFIYPGSYKWKVVDALITNFHLPKSTLIMLVASFLENKGVDNPVEKIKEIYEIAKKEKYRFYSFGDAMFII